MLHPQFRLNGTGFSSSLELLEYAVKKQPEIALFLKDWFEDSAYLKVQTSGSTGTPKIIELEKKSMMASAKATGAFFKVPAGSSALLCMSSAYIAGKMMLVRAMVLGWDLEVIPVVSNPLKLTEKRYDFAAMIPLQVHHSFGKLEQIDQLIIGGGVIATSLLKKIAGLDTKVFATYGMTETITHIAAKRLNGVGDAFYKTLPGITLKVDTRDCLVIDAPQLSQEPIYTNDVVELIDSYSFNWLGRYDSVINSGGIKLIPEQIELKLSSVLQERFFISSEPDEVLGNKLIIIVELENSSVALGKEYLDRIKETKLLSKFEIPKKVLFLNKFIETPTQKINRKASLALL